MKYFNLFACCKMVKGTCRFIIIDLQRGVYETIPNDLYELVIENRGVSKDEIFMKKITTLLLMNILTF